MMKSTDSSIIRILLDIFRKGSAFVILILIAGAFAIMSDQFLTLNNILTITMQTSIIALSAIGMTFVIITGGIDLSVGSVAALSGAVAAGLATRNGLGTYPGILIGLGAAILVGALNGIMVVYGRIPPFVATLATMAVARGLTLVYTNGNPISGLDKSFTFWADKVLGIPVPFLILVVVAIIAYIVLSHSAFGLHVFAIGGGEETARLASVPARKVKMGVYLISGFLAGITGIILTARLWSAQPNSGVGLELDVIAAAVLGGASLAGGSGGIPGTIAGAFIIGILSNGLNLMEVPSYNQQVIKGLMFIFAVLLDYLLKRRMAASIQNGAQG